MEDYAFSAKVLKALSDTNRLKNSYASFQKIINLSS